MGEQHGYPSSSASSSRAPYNRETPLSITQSHERQFSSRAPHGIETPLSIIQSHEHQVWSGESSSWSDESGNEEVALPRTGHRNEVEQSDPNSHVVWGLVGENSSSSTDEFSKKEKKETDMDEVLFLQEDPEEELDERQRLAHRYRHYSKEELVGIVPYDEKGNFTSVGSISHSEGGCVACPFVLRAKGCKRSHWCGLCHFDHGMQAKNKYKKQRPTKGDRLRYKKCMARVTREMAQAADAGSFDMANIDRHLMPSIQRNPTKKKYFENQVRSHVANQAVANTNSTSSTKFSL